MKMINQKKNSKSARNAIENENHIVRTSGTEIGTESNKELESFNGLQFITFLDDKKLAAIY